MKAFVQKHYIKIIFLLAIVAVTGAFFLNYMYRQEVQKGKASQIEQLQLNFTPNAVTAPSGTDFSSLVVLNPLINFTTTGYDFVIPFDTTKLQVKGIEYKAGVVDPSGDDDTKLARVNTDGVVHIKANFADTNGRIIQTGQRVDLVNLSFTSRSASSSTTTLEYAQPHYFNCIAGCSQSQVDVIADELIVNGAQNTITPTPTCTPGDNCNPPIPTRTPTPPNPNPTCDPRNLHCFPTDTPIPVRGNTTLNMKVKLQGILSKPRTANPLAMKVIVKGGLLQSEVTQSVQFQSNPDGTWSGQMAFDLPPNPFDYIPKYSIYIKGPKHLQKRICDTTPTESGGGTYRCTKDGVPLDQGQYSLDFSGVLLLAGDLPITNGNQQNSVIDSEDTTYIRQNFGKTDADVLSKADLNLDGNIDSQDFTLVIGALSIKYDDPIEGQ